MRANRKLTQKSLQKSTKRPTDRASERVLLSHHRYNSLLCMRNSRVKNQGKTSVFLTHP